MVTIFSCPKAFKGHVSVIQRNAIRSWRRAVPDAKIMLCGDEEGVAAAAREVDGLHETQIKVNEYGTPLLNSVFAAAMNSSEAGPMCYVNADVMLDRDLVMALQDVPFARFVMGSRRTDVRITSPVDFAAVAPDESLLQAVADSWMPGEASAIDIFVFTRDRILTDMPPFAIGRPGWDNWFIYNAIRHRIPVVDASGSVTVIHQEHGYDHVPDRRSHHWEGPEGDLNRELAGGWNHLFNLLDATHVLQPGAGVCPARSPEHLDRRVERMRLLRPRLFRQLVSWRVRYMVCRFFPWL